MITFIKRHVLLMRGPQPPLTHEQRGKRLRDNLVAAAIALTVLLMVVARVGPLGIHF